MNFDVGDIFRHHHRWILQMDRLEGVGRIDIWKALKLTNNIRRKISMTKVYSLTFSSSSLLKIRIVKRDKV